MKVMAFKDKMKIVQYLDNRRSEFNTKPRAYICRAIKADLGIDCSLNLLSTINKEAELGLEFCNRNVSGGKQEVNLVVVAKVIRDICDELGITKYNSLLTSVIARQRVTAEDYEVAKSSPEASEAIARKG